MVEVDRIMVEDLGIALVQMMEHAGRHMATVVRNRFPDGDVGRRQVGVLCGSGGNGGGGLVAARRLHSWGAEVAVILAKPPGDYVGVVAEQLAIVDQLGIRIDGAVDSALPEYDLVVDALVGYSLNGPLSGRVADLVAAANEAACPVVSLDVPSGVDSTTGAVEGTAVRADATVSLALPKRGLRGQPGREHTGDLYLADIGVPPVAYKAVLDRGRGTDPFRHGDLVRIW